MMVAPALCTGWSGQFFRISRLFQFFQAFQGFLYCCRWYEGGLDIPGMLGPIWRSLDVLGHVWTVPGHLVWGTCWLATPVGTRSAKLTAGSRIDVEVAREQLGGQGILCFEVCCGVVQVVPPNCPLVGGTSCFSMGRVRSGWLSKFWCVPELFRVIPEWFG